MSFRALLDHRVDVVRPSDPASADAIADERPVYTAVYENVRCAFWPIHAPVGDYGAGETPQGITGASFEKSVTVQPRDIIVTVAGPETPKRWRIVADRSPGRRFGRGKHHVEVQATPFDITRKLPGYDTAVGGAYS